jgi:hypothetical protein
LRRSYSLRLLNKSLIKYSFFLILAFPLWSSAGDDIQPEAKVYVIHKLSDGEVIKIDGELNEPGWAAANIAKDFTQQAPNQGELATQKTEARLLYDEKNLYIGIRCWQTGKVIVTDMHRDFGVGDNDILEIILDTYHDHMNGFDFSTNPSGALMDAQWSGNGSESNMNWNGVWDVRTRIYEDSWTAEFVIPFKTLRFTGTGIQEWGINFRRSARYINEGSTWSPLPRRFMLGMVSLAGTVKGIEDVQPGRNLKLKPFISGSATRIPSRPGKPDYYLGKFGLDLKYGLTTGLTFDFTANTDFSQVEADVQQVNLTRFSLFFPEKREFFLENSTLFHLGEVLGGGSSDVMLFYSRRIGLDDSGNPIPLLGGVRLSGHVQNYEIGFLNMQSKEVGKSPANNFTVARIRRHIAKNSDFGAMFVNRQATSVDGNYNRAFGLDTNLRFTRNLTLSAFLSKSQTPGKFGKDWSAGVNFALSKNNYKINAKYREVQPNFNSELGFVRRTDVRLFTGTFTLLFHPEDFLKIREIRPNVSASEYLTTENKLDTLSLIQGLDISFHNGSLFQIRREQDHEILSKNFVAFPGRAIPTGDYRYSFYHVSYSHNNTRLIAPNFQFEKGAYYDGDRSKVVGGIKVHPSAHLSFETSLERDKISIPAGTYGISLLLWRINYSFTTRMFLDALIQYNSRTGQVNSNIRFNLIHHPLSDLFIVYNDNRDWRYGGLVNRVLSIKFTQLFDF